MATTSTFSGAMRTKFIGPIRDILYSNRILLEGLRNRDGEKSDLPAGSREFRGIIAEAEGIDHVGNEFRIPIRVSRNQGVGSRAENVILPAPGNTGFVQITEPLRHHYGLFNITGQLLKASESSEGAFKRALTTETKDTTESLKMRVNIQAYGNGDGSLGVVSGNAGPTTTIPVTTTINFRVGEIVDIRDISGSAWIAAARTVTAVNRAGLTVTISGANVTVETGDLLVGASSDSTTAVPNNDFNQALTGLAKIVSNTGVLHTLDPATVPQWAASVVDAAGAVVGENLLRQLSDAVGFESGDDQDMVGIWTRGMRNRYANTLMSLKRFTNEQSTTLRGGFKAILFDDKPMVIDDQCPPGTMYMLDTSSLFWSQSSDWEWMDNDGEVLKWEPRYDRYIAVLFKYANMGTFARNRNGKIINAADDVR